MVKQTNEQMKTALVQPSLSATFKISIPPLHHAAERALSPLGPPCLSS